MAKSQSRVARPTRGARGLTPFQPSAAGVCPLHTGTGTVVDDGASPRAVCRPTKRRARRPGHTRSGQACRSSGSAIAAEPSRAFESGGLGKHNCCKGEGKAQ